jgi:N-acetylneuraminate synthase
MVDFNLANFKDNKVLFIAEIGINHNGSIELTKKLIDMAHFCGADVVKFQKRTPEICVPLDVRDKIRETPWGEMTYFEYKKRIEFEKNEYDEIDIYCKSKGILWTASAWDEPSVDFLEGYGVPFHKVPSALLTHKSLLFKLKSTNKPVILSSGMSTSDEIAKAVEIFGKGYPIGLLHCNSAYPSKDENLHLNYIGVLKETYPNYTIGYSGHEQGISASLVAVTAGANIVERHITLDRAMWGTDQAASVEMSGLRRLIRDIRKVPIWMGKAEKIVSEDEQKVKAKLRYINDI